MTTSAEIGVPDAELEELMAQLEMETGVAVAASPPPVTKPKPSVVLSEEDELLAALDDQPTAAAAATVVVAADPAPVTANVATVLVPEDEVTALENELNGAADEARQAGVHVTPEDELAALERELAGEPVAVKDPVVAVGTPQVTAVKTLEVVQEVADSSDDERGMSFIPGEVLVDPETAPKPAPKPTAAPVEAHSAPGVDPFGPASTGGLQFFTDPSKFTATTSISDNDLDKCMIEQNGLRSFYGTEAARAERQAARIKVKFEILEATLYEEHRRLAAEEGEKVTEKALENRVKSDPRWGKGKLMVIDAAGISDINRALVESLRDRKDMLVQLGADRRDEMKGQARVMGAAGIAQELRDRAMGLVKEQQQS